MVRIRMLAALLATAAALVPSAGRAQTPAAAPPPFTFTSASVDLPNGTRMFPGGKEAEAVNNNCLTCHSVGMVTTQPLLTKAAWDAEVHKMINVFKAPIPAEDVPAIVAYLTTIKIPN